MLGILQFTLFRPWRLLHQTFQNHPHANHLLMARLRSGRPVPQHHPRPRPDHDSLGGSDRSGHINALQLRFGRNFYAQNLPTDPPQIRHSETNERGLQQKGRQDVSTVKVHRRHWVKPVRLLLLVLCRGICALRLFLDHRCPTNDAKSQGLLLSDAPLVTFGLFRLASLGVALGFEHLFFDPLFTLIFGNTSFYRVRGFFYDFKLGERFKEIEEWSMPDMLFGFL